MYTNVNHEICKLVISGFFHTVTLLMVWVLVLFLQIGLAQESVYGNDIDIYSDKDDGYQAVGLHIQNNQVEKEY